MSVSTPGRLALCSEHPSLTLSPARARSRSQIARAQERRDGKRSVFGNIELTPGPGAYNGDVALNPLVKRSFNITLGGLEAL